MSMVKGQKIGSLTGGMTLAEVALELGITRQRVQQLERRAMKKLYEAAKKMGLKVEDLR